MNHIKIYEKFFHNFEIGNYVIANNSDIYIVEFENFITNNVGKIVDITLRGLRVKYNNFFITNNISVFFDKDIYTVRNQSEIDVLRLATKEEIETQKLKNQAAKYNL